MAPASCLIACRNIACYICIYMVTCMDCVVSYKQQIAVKDEGGVDCIVMSEEL